MFLKNKNIIFKIRRSKVTDYAALSLYKHIPCNTFLVIIANFILDLHIHIDIINNDLPILYLKGSQVKISIF